MLEIGYIFNSGGIIFSFLIFLYILLKNIENSTTSAIFCIDCGECSLACPIIEHSNRFGGPWKILMAIRANNPEQAEKLLIFMCNECKRCNNACVLGLDITADIRQFKAILYKSGKAPKNYDLMAQRLRDTKNIFGASNIDKRNSFALKKLDRLKAELSKLVKVK